MKIVLQRVTEASVTVHTNEISRIGKGLLLLLGIAKDDNEDDILYLIEKVAHLRIFPNENDNLNLSCLDVHGEFLVVSQFTLLADTKKGRRPSFFDACEPDKAKILCKQFVESLKKYGRPVKEGEFAAMMKVQLVNDGPVTIVMDSRR